MPDILAFHYRHHDSSPALTAGIAPAFTQRKRPVDITLKLSTT